MNTGSPAIANHPAIPLCRDLPQAEICRMLDALCDFSGRFDVPLDVLEKWSRAVGYFDHIREPNEVLVFPSAELGVDLRLQINYSRLGYQAPAPTTGNDLQQSTKCLLCFDNVASQSKPLLRAFELSLGADDQKTHFAHPTPFPLCAGHFVLNRMTHEPMRMDVQAVRDALAFLARAPGWLVVSNSDVEWAGASILTHHHAQVFRDLRLPIECARAISASALAGGVTASELHWPGPVLKVDGPVDATVAACDKLIRTWKATDPGQATCNFIARLFPGNQAAVYLVWRHPDFRTEGWVREIKSEGVGIVEMAGEVIVPPNTALSREENTQFFREKSIHLISSLIQMNSPTPRQEKSVCRQILDAAFA